MSVGQLNKAILTISSNEKQDTWFVEKVTVQEGRYSKTRNVFASKMWFGNAIIGEDGNTVLEADLQLEGKIFLFCFIYFIGYATKYIP